MTTLEQRLNEIVEKEQADAIIPFLQRLTQEERKSLVACLNKLENYYHTIVQLNKNSYGCRATPAQHRIIGLAALVLYSLKEYRKHEWSINVDWLNEIRSWHIPSWLDTYFKEGEGKEFSGFSGMDYNVLMDWVEQGILTTTPSPQAIADYLVNHINNTELLQKRAITLNEHFWYLFQYDCGQNWADGRNGGQPYYSFRYFVEHGQLDRTRVLRESLLAVNRNLNKNLCGWFAGMFVAFEPTIDEQFALLPEMLAVLSSPQSRPVGIMLGLLKDLCSHPRFDVEEFLGQASVLFASDVKAVHQSTLAVLAKLAKERKEYREAICCAAVQGLMSRDESTQSKIVKLIKTYGDAASTPLREALSVYTETLLVSTKKELSAYVTEESATPSAPATFIYEPASPIISDDNQIPEVSSTEDLLFLASQVLDGNEPYHFYLFLGALVRYNRQLEASQVSQWTPVLQRAYKLITSGGNSRTGPADILMATFLIDYGKLLIHRFPQEAKALSTLHEKTMQQDEANKRKWHYRNFRTLSIRNKAEKRGILLILSRLLCHTLDMLSDDTYNGLPLLSTPTHAPMFLSPTVLIERLKAYQQQQVEPDDVDMQIALSRVAMDESSSTALRETITTQLEGEYRSLLLFLFGDPDATPQPPFAHPSWWMTAALIKSPNTIYPAFKDFSYSRGPREYLTGGFAWHTFQKVSSYVDYDKKVVEWTVGMLSFHMPEDENVHIRNKGKYNEWLDYRSYDAHPLLVEMCYAGVDDIYNNATNELLRLASLVANTPEPLLMSCIRTAIYKPSLNEVRETNITQAAIAVLHRLRHTWHDTSYLLEACCMLTADKTARSYAAEVWIERVGQGRIDSVRLGKILGSHQRTGWGPMKRLTDLVQQQMMNISPLHNHELEKLLTALLIELSETPIKDLKKLLELYAELLSVNHSKVTNDELRRRLQQWTASSNLKKVVGVLNSL